MIKICENCNEEFKTPNSKRKYCSRQCYSKTQSKSQITICPECGKERLRQLKDIKRYAKLYCSIECRNKHNLIGKNSPRYLERVLKKCCICEKDIKVTQARNVEGNTCSAECKKIFMQRHSASKKKRVIKKCSFCEKEKEVHIYRTKIIKNFFCDQNCKTEWQKINTPLREKSPSWKGGTTNLDYSIRESKGYQKLRTLCFERDNYTSILSGIGGNKGFGRLNHHHLQPLSEIISQNNITKDNWRDYLELLYDIDNVVTLLESEHILFHTKYGKAASQEKFEEFKNNYLICQI